MTFIILIIKDFISHVLKKKKEKEKSNIEIYYYKNKDYNDS